MAKGKIKPMRDVAEDEFAQGVQSDDFSKDTSRSRRGAQKIPEEQISERGRDYTSQEMGPDFGRTKPSTNLPKIAGIILIIVAIATLISAYMLLTTNIDEFADQVDPSLSSYVNQDETVTIEGRVVGENGAPLENVTISINHTNFVTSTDSQGEFVLNDVPIGNAIIVVEKENYTTIEHKINIEGASTSTTGSSRVDLDFKLKQGSGVEQTGSYRGSIHDLLEVTLQVCGAVMIIGAIIVIAAAISALQRKRFYLVALGCIFGLLVGLSLIVGTILSVIALVLAYISRKEFN
jgi:hypothetical protein